MQNLFSAEWSAAYAAWAGFAAQVAFYLLTRVGAKKRGVRAHARLCRCVEAAAELAGEALKAVPVDGISLDEWRVDAAIRSSIALSNQISHMKAEDLSDRHYHSFDHIRQTVIDLHGEINNLINRDSNDFEEKRLIHGRIQNLRTELLMSRVKLGER